MVPLGSGWTKWDSTAWKLAWALFTDHEEEDDDAVARYPTRGIVWGWMYALCFTWCVADGVPQSASTVVLDGGVCLWLQHHRQGVRTST